ncbi:MAG: DUF2273 domain-containing protein [Alicyclobacillaceae bacterium]|nr:DUF2273 domain-containing protein [Alicyclobacillaceae bacterium]
MSWLRSVLLQVLTMRRRWQGLLAGCAVWLLWMIVGFWATLLLFVLAAIGFVVGAVLETPGAWKAWVEKLLSQRFGE